MCDDRYNVWCLSNVRVLLFHGASTLKGHLHQDATEISLGGYDRTHARWSDDPMTRPIMSPAYRQRRPRNIESIWESNPIPTGYSPMACDDDDSEVWCIMRILPDGRCQWRLKTKWPPKWWIINKYGGNKQLIIEHAWCRNNVSNSTVKDKCRSIDWSDLLNFLPLVHTLLH